MFILERLIDVIAPHVCITCGHEGAILCDWCLPDSALPLPDRCYRCKKQTDNSLVCKSCRRTSRIDHMWVRTGYGGMAKRLVYDLKFARKQAVTVSLARLMTECLPFFSTDITVTHVPTASKRIRQRGYDHAQLLARALANEKQLPYTPLLRRVGKTRQVGATREDRLNQLNGAFGIFSRARIRGGSILLVDDIVTTGGTLEAVAWCLRRAGAKRVDAVVFATERAMTS